MVSSCLPLTHVIITVSPQGSQTAEANKRRGQCGTNTKEEPIRPKEDRSPHSDKIDGMPGLLGQRSHEVAKCRDLHALVPGVKENTAAGPSGSDANPDATVAPPWTR